MGRFKFGGVALSIGEGHPVFPSRHWRKEHTDHRVRITESGDPTCLQNT